MIGRTQLCHRENTVHDKKTFHHKKSAFRMVRIHFIIGRICLIQIISLIRVKRKLHTHVSSKKEQDTHKDKTKEKNKGDTRYSGIKSMRHPMRRYS